METVQRTDSGRRAGDVGLDQWRDSRRGVSRKESGTASGRGGESAGGTGSRRGQLREIRELSRQAALVPSYEANLDETRERLATSEALFDRLRDERRDLVEAQREAFDRVLSEVEREFEGRIRGRRIDNGVVKPLDAFLRTLKQKGITRWWNDLVEGRKPSPGRLTELLDRELTKRRIGGVHSRVRARPSRRVRTPHPISSKCPSAKLA